MVAQTTTEPIANIIVRGKKKTVTSLPGGDTVIDCKGRRGKCVGFGVPKRVAQGETQEVYLYDESGEKVEKILTISTKRDVKFSFRAEDEGSSIITLPTGK